MTVVDFFESTNKIKNVLLWLLSHKVCIDILIGLPIDGGL